MKRPKEENNPTHPDMRTDAPGRIPESLINAAIDGELSDEMQQEIAHALRYDPLRKQELVETADAINALQMPIPSPDFSDAILTRADRHHRFIPASWRRGVRAALLLTLMGVAGLQRIYPRLTTLASHPTPVLDIEQAVEHDTDRFAHRVHNEVRTLQASLTPLPPLAPIVRAPGRTDQRFELTLNTTPNRAPRVMRAQRGVGAVYFAFEARSLNVSNASLITTDRPQSPLFMLGSARIHAWAIHHESSETDSIRESKTRTESDRIDIPDLP